MTKTSVSRLTDFGTNGITHALSLEIMEARNETFLRFKLPPQMKDINHKAGRKSNQ